MLNRSVVLLGLVFALATAPVSHAQRSERAADRFTFTAGNAGDRLDLVINRWSTDAERDSVFAAALKDPAKLLDAVKEPGIVGYIHLPGGLDYTIRYARRVSRADGTVDIVALADAPVWVWWQPGISDTSTPNRYLYTAFQLRLSKTGTGEGKLSVTKVAADKEAGVVLANYASEPTLLTDVKRDVAS